MAKVIALYLPQFHPTPENDEWWGKGFTEWTNVGKAKSLFKGHYQPRVPADLGYYDLRVPEVREQQAELAREAGVDAFCYYHYYFGNGKRILERPFTEVVKSGKPDFPFCLCWANHTWSNKTWEKASSSVKDQIFAEQTYGGEKDYTEHFYCLIDAFKDNRYLKIEGKIVFVVYDVVNFKDVSNFLKTWRKLAEENGLPGFYFIGMISATLGFTIDKNGNRKTALPNLKSSADLYNYVLAQGFDAVNSFGKTRGELMNRGVYTHVIDRVLNKFGIHRSYTYDYNKTVANYFAPEDSWENVFPTILPQWDRSPRRGDAEGVYVNQSPDNFYKHVKKALSIIEKKNAEHQVIFLKSWNEWAEGNYMEPDLKYGHGYINALKKALDEKNSK